MVLKKTEEERKCSLDALQFLEQITTQKEKSQLFSKYGIFFNCFTTKVIYLQNPKSSDTS